jgi:hypothetical protein
MWTSVKLSRSCTVVDGECSEDGGKLLDANAVDSRFLDANVLEADVFQESLKLPNILAASSDNFRGVLRWYLGADHLSG